MNPFSITGRAVLGALILIAYFSSNAYAIQCNGNFQVQLNGKEIATPYCEDNYLAEVAREAGIPVSNFEIRENPSKKEEVCRVVGHDNRVYETCEAILDDGPGDKS